MTANSIIAFFVLATIALFAVVTYRSFRKRNKSTSELDRANFRIETLEGDVSTLRGQIGVLLGDNHPGGGMRAPYNTERYRDRIAEMEAETEDEAENVEGRRVSKNKVISMDQMRRMEAAGELRELLPGEKLTKGEMKKISRKRREPEEK